MPCSGDGSRISCLEPRLQYEQNVFMQKTQTHEFKWCTERNKIVVIARQTSEKENKYKIYTKKIQNYKINLLGAKKKG